MTQIFVYIWIKTKKQIVLKSLIKIFLETRVLEKDTNIERHGTEDDVTRHSRYVKKAQDPPRQDNSQTNLWGKSQENIEWQTRCFVLP